MGKIQIITKEQEILLDEIRQNIYLRNLFYFTGGTALSYFYFQHRVSDDLDFFTQSLFKPKEVIDFLKLMSKKYNFTFSAQSGKLVVMVKINWGRHLLKVDFARYPYKQLGKTRKINELTLDSLLDIGVNKLSMLAERTEVKDFVDLYFILKHLTIWDLIEGVRVKFNMEINPFILASDFTKAYTFYYLPKMIKPLSLPKLKDFYKKNAVAIGRKNIS